MVTMLYLPTEIVAQIVRYSNVNGDLSSLRLSNSRLLNVASSQPSLLLEDLSIGYGVSARALHLYLSQNQGITPVCHFSEPKILDVLVLGQFLHSIGILGMDVDRALVHASQSPIQDSRPSSREPFVLFAVFNQIINSSLITSHSTASDLLTPSPDGAQIFSKRPSERFVQFLKQELTLKELEAIIGAISVCATRLWNAVFMFRPKDTTVSGFGSISGASFNADQAILTEHIIWRGPLWVARILRLFAPSSERATQIESAHEIDDSLIREGMWRGSREEGARLAANGVARLLWKERQDRIEARASAAQKVSITDMRVSASVWRGSSGDM